MRPERTYQISEKNGLARRPGTAKRRRHSGISSDRTNRYREGSPAQEWFLRMAYERALLVMDGLMFHGSDFFCRL